MVVIPRTNPKYVVLSIAFVLVSRFTIGNEIDTLNEKLTKLCNEARSLVFFHNLTGTNSRLSDSLDKFVNLNLILRHIRNSYMLFSGDAEPINVNEQVKQADADLIIIVIDAPDNICGILEVIRTMRIVGPYTRMVILLQQEKVNNEDFLKLIWLRLRIFRVALINTSCENLTIYKRNNFKITYPSYSVPLSGEIFDDKLPTDFEGFPLRLGYIPRPPFIIKSKISGNLHEGVDGYIIQTIVKALNMSISVIENKDNFPLRLHVDGKPNGYFGMLQKQEIDVFCSAVTILFDRASFSIPLPAYLYDVSTWIVPKNNNYTNWIFLYGSFSFLIWLLMLFSILSFTFIIFFTLKKKFNLFDILFKIFGTILEAGVSWPFGYIFIFLILPLMILSASYKCGLVSLLTRPVKPKQIDSLNEAFQQGLTFTFPQVVAHSLNLSDEQIWKHVFHSGKYRTSDNLTQLNLLVAHEKKSICIGTKLVYDYSLARFNLFDDSGNELIAKFSEHFGAFPVYIFMSPGNPLEPLFRRYIVRFIEQGLIDHYLDNFMFIEIRKSRVKSEGRKKVAVGRQRSLTLYQLSALFYLYIAMVLLSLLVFILELFLKYSRVNHVM